jgi:toxin CptA
MRSSNASAPCRFELRPSRWRIGAMAALAVLAPFAVLVSDLSGVVAWPLAVVVLCSGMALAWRERRRPVHAVVIDATGVATVDGLAVDRFRIDWRGPLAFVSWRDGLGRTFRRSLWPDTLSAAGRRELRLAADRDDAGRRSGPMAP